MKVRDALLERLKKVSAKTRAIKVKAGRKKGHAEFHFKGWEAVSLTAALAELSTGGFEVEEWSSDKVVGDALEKESHFKAKQRQETGVATPAELLSLAKFAGELTGPYLLKQVMMAQGRVTKRKCS